MWPLINQFSKPVFNKLESGAKKVGKAVGNAVLDNLDAGSLYVGNIKRNIRDVGTAAGTNVQIARSGKAKSIQGKPLDVAGAKNFSTQVKEVGGAFLGKPGTRSDQYSKEKGYVSNIGRIPPKP